MVVGGGVGIVVVFSVFIGGFIYVIEELFYFVRFVVLLLVIIIIFLVDILVDVFGYFGFNFGGGGFNSIIGF